MYQVTLEFRQRVINDLLLGHSSTGIKILDSPLSVERNGHPARTFAEGEEVGWLVKDPFTQQVTTRIGTIIVFSQRQDGRGRQTAVATVAVENSTEGPKRMSVPVEQLLKTTP